MSAQSKNTAHCVQNPHSSDLTYTSFKPAKTGM